MENKFYFFYATRHPFSQWHPCKFKIDDIEYNCAEQYMMYQKAILFKDFKTAGKILKTNDPKIQKALGREVKDFHPVAWDFVAKDIVYKGNYAKFTQNENLLQVLKDTKDLEIVEASPYDKIWGIGLSEEDADRFDKSKWKGTNWLGEVLTHLRDNLK